MTELEKWYSEQGAEVIDYHIARIALTSASTHESIQNKYNEYVKNGLARPREIISFSGSSIQLGPVLAEHK